MKGDDSSSRATRQSSSSTTTSTAVACDLLYTVASLFIRNHFFSCDVFWPRERAHCDAVGQPSLHIRIAKVFALIPLHHEKISDGKTLVWQFNCTSTCSLQRIASFFLSHYPFRAHFKPIPIDVLVLVLVSACRFSLFIVLNRIHCSCCSYHL